MNATQLSKISKVQRVKWASCDDRESGGKGRGHHRTRPGQHTNIFLPGQPVPESGIYEVIHERAHRQAHEAVMYRNDPFPICDQCEKRVRFKLIRSAPYIFDDEDFAKE